jgi:prevent-host-death family protein
MSKIPTIVPITDLRQDAASVLQKVKDSAEPVFITQRGRATAVLVNMEEYERSEHDRDLLKLLIRGEKEITTGKGYDLDSVFAEADSLLAED